MVSLILFIVGLVLIANGLLQVLFKLEISSIMRANIYFGTLIACVLIYVYVISKARG